MSDARSLSESVRSAVLLTPERSFILTKSSWLRFANLLKPDLGLFGLFLDLSLVNILRPRIWANSGPSIGRLTQRMARFASKVERKSAYNMVPVASPFKSTLVSALILTIATTEVLYETRLAKRHDFGL